MNSRKLALRKETLTELSGQELVGVAAGAAASVGGAICIVVPPTVRTCVTCVDTLTIASCSCPVVTGPSCACPTDYGCA